MSIMAYGKGYFLGRSLTSQWYPIGNKSVEVIQVRWRRPLWLPPTASRLFRIPQRIRYPEAEINEVLRLYNNYRTNMKCVSKYCSDEYERVHTSVASQLETEREEREKHKELMELNRKENERMALLRHAREEDEDIKMRKQVKATKEFDALKMERRRGMALKTIAETEALVKTFIKREDIVKAIEIAIANKVDYNYSIDLDGHIYRGRHTKPEEIREEDKEMLKIAQA